MSMSSFEAKIEKVREINNLLATTTCKVNNECRAHLTNSGAHGAIIFTHDEMFYGIVEYEPSENTQDLTVHFLTQNKDLVGYDVMICEIFKIRKSKRFHSQFTRESQLKKDYLSLKLRFGILQESSPDYQAIQIPDVLYTRLVEQCFGVNRGVLNTIDLWLWERGMNSIVHRKQEILQFLVQQSKSQHVNRKIRFGAGQLIMRLEKYWRQRTIRKNVFVSN